ncbi:Reverse transcriptase domain protein [Pyrenophora tritici-repentis]|nr:Reverse transcriptase domain protein [Pyrenophora tritici-repentis]
MGGEEIEQDKEQYEGGLPTPEPSNLSLHNDQDLISEQQAIDEQLVQEQQRNVVQGSQDISATQIEGYIPDRYKNNAPRRRNLDLSTDNIIEGPRRTRRIADLQEPERWHSHAVTYGGSVDNYLKAFSTALRAEPTTKIHCTQVPRAPQSYRELDHHQFGEQFRDAAQKEYREIWGKGCFAKTTQTAETANAEVLPLMWVFTYKFDEDGYLYRFKARLVVRGDLEQLYGDTYAATLAARTFRALIAIANQFGLELLQYDVPNAFLNATLNRKLYAETPDGFKKDGELLQVLRALYGLKESPLL